MSAETTQRLPARAAARRGPAQAITAPGLDYWLIALIATLLGLGLFMVYSASFPSQGSYFFLRQILWIAIGLVACAITAFIPIGWWKRLAVPMMIGTLLLLLAVLALGGERNGAVRHLLGGSLQPSEIAKFTVTIYVAAWVAAKGAKLAQFEDGLLPFVFIIGLVAGLIALERSFSVTIITLTIGMVIFFVGGGNAKQLGILLLIGAPILLGAMMLSGYPMDRFRDWYAVHFNPSAVSQDTLRILEMLRSGRGIGTDPSFWGPKLGVSLLWSDYLFANIGADLHFPGTFLVVALYVGLAYRGLGIALERTRSVCRVDRAWPYHVDHGAGGGAHRCVPHADPDHRTAAAIHELWRVVAAVVHGRRGPAVEHLALGDGKEGSLCAFWFRVAGLAATFTPSSPSSAR